jgi:hypothetical protein
MGFRTSLAALAWMASAPAFAQSSVRDFELGGSAVVLDEQCIRLTPDRQFDTGSAWFKTPIDLSRPFEMKLLVVLGEKDLQGADGIVFVFHPGKETGYRGEGMGFAGLIPSLGVELDTYQNGHLGDPASDHLSVMQNGRSFHFSESEAIELGNLEDGKKHPLQISWNPETGLTIRLDGRVRATYGPDVVKGAFDGLPTVYWGMTAATGRLSNAQDVCVETLRLSA